MKTRGLWCGSSDSEEADIRLRTGSAGDELMCGARLER